MVRRVDQNGALVWCRKYPGYAAEKGTNIDESMQAGGIRHERIWKDVETNLNARRGEGPCKNARGRKIEGQKKRGHQEGVQSLRWRRFRGAKRVVEHRQKRASWKTEDPCPEKTETCSRNATPKPHTRETSSAVCCGWTWEVKRKESV